MILTTTPTVEGKSISSYCGPIGAEVIFGAMFLKDWVANATDIWGGRNGVYEKVFSDARERAAIEIETKARSLRADAVVGLRFTYQVMGENNGMMMVAATGTAVNLVLKKEEREQLEAAQKLHAAEDEPKYILNIGPKSIGPLSIVQLRQLVEGGKVSLDQKTYDENGDDCLTVGELIGP